MTGSPDQRRPVVLSLTGSHLRREDRAHRVERRVVGLHLPVLVEDLDELAEVSALPVAARALALLEDRVDRALRRGAISDGHQLRPAEVLGRRLRARRTHEQPGLAVLLREVRDAVLDRAVQVPHGGEVLPPGHDVALRHQRGRALERGVEPFRSLQLHALGPFEEHEMP